jgi:hypothetical protein
MNTKTPKSAIFALPRRDGTGHLNPIYARDLRPGNLATVDPNTAAFLNGARSRDPLAEQFGEAMLETATSGQDSGADNHDRIVTEEAGGPFLEINANAEFAYAMDDASETQEPRPSPPADRGRESRYAHR